ncbi:hypothetical protein AB0F72_18975 [Actinoplanes sp. NPDC023936]|uniref:hypothetical protein n=1 Tax=Actinoplanes sp. NPDC023936 TaxID=3154910 RepID=UPI0033EF15F7
MKTEVRNRLTMTKGVISARLAPKVDDRYAWVWIAPLRNGTFRVSTVEIPRNLIDDDISFYEPDIDRTVVATVGTVQEAEEIVISLGVDADDLAPPWHNAFPL